jgi:plastocyanin
MGAVAAVAATLLIGGTVWAAVDDRYPPKDGFERDHLNGEETEGPDGGETPTPGNVIQLDDNVFIFNGEENPDITATAGTDVTFELTNVGAALHNMHIAVGGSFDESICDGSGDPCSDPPRINAGDDGTITFNLPAGSYDYRCDFHTTEMFGTLIVQ